MLDLWCGTFYSCSQGARRSFGGWLLLRKAHSWALCLTTSCALSSVSLFCLVSLSLGAILWPSRLLDLDMYVGVDPLVVLPIFLKKVANIIAPKLSIIFRGLIHLRSFPEC